MTASRAAVACLAISAKTAERVPRWASVLISVAALIAAIPWPRVGAGAFYDWTTMVTFLFRLDGLAVLVMLTALLAALAERSEQEPDRPGDLPRWRDWYQDERRIGIGCALVVLAGAFSFTARPAPVQQLIM